MTKHLAWVALVGACIAPPSEEGQLDQDIHGPSSAANQFQLDRAASMQNCTGTRISPQFVLTALHCTLSAGAPVFYYTAGPGTNPNAATVVNVRQRPGTSASACLQHQEGPGGCTDSTNLFADIALLQVSFDVAPSGIFGGFDVLDGPAATLAWTYPNSGASGQVVGAGQDAGTLRQVPDTTSSSDSNGRFFLSHQYGDHGDSGGPFYVASQVVGALHGDDGSYTSVPRHLDWILTQIGYLWTGSPPQPNIAYSGTSLQSIVGTERVCQYACEHTASCQAYNYLINSSSCGLVTGINHTFTSANTHSALRFGARSGRVAPVVGYVRGDGLSSIVHFASGSHVHELALKSTGWAAYDLAATATAAPGAKLSAYLRSDGVSVIVFRDTAGHIIEGSLGATHWSWNDLTSFGGPTAVGDPVGYVRADGVNAVVYRSSNNHINELRLTTTTWFWEDLTIDSTIPAPATSDPSVTVRSDGYTSVLFRSGDQIFELFKTARYQWDWGQPSAFATFPGTSTLAPPAASKPFGYAHHDGTIAIVYRSTANRIIELWLDGAGWHWQDLTGSGPLAQGDPTAYVRSDALEAVVYRSTANQIIELANNPWQAGNLTVQAGAGSATSDPSVYIRRDGYNAVVFNIAGNHVAELAIHIGDSIWRAADLTVFSGEGP